MDKVSVNPFVHRLQFTKLDYVKIFLGTIFLFPIRLMLCVLLFTLNSMLAKLFLQLLEKWQLNEEEEIKWRTIFKKPCIFLMRVMFFVCGFYNFKVTDKSGTNDKDKPRILVVAPHTSPFDIIIGLVLGAPSPVARHDAVDIPLFGNLINLTSPVFVQRDSQSSRQNVFINVVEKLRHNSVIFFPEGTCSNHRVLAQFKPGAFKLGLPVQPLLIKYDQFGGPDTLSWTWDGPSALKQIWLTLCRWSTGFEMIKLPMYFPNEQEKQDPEIFANNICRMMAQKLDMAASFYSFDDLLFFNDLNTLRSPACLKLMKLCQKVVNEVPVEKIIELNCCSNGYSNGNSSEKLNKLENGQNGVYQRQMNGEVKSKNSKNSTIEKKKKQKQIVSELAQKIVENILDKFEKPFSIKTLHSSKDLQDFLNLNQYEILNKSTSLSQLWQCLEKVPNTSTIHMAVILKLCDSRKQNLWHRFEDCFDLLKDDGDNEISFENFKNFLWLALGFDAYDDRCFQINESITFEYLKQNLVSFFRRTVEENASQILQQINE